MSKSSTELINALTEIMFDQPLKYDELLAREKIRIDEVLEVIDAEKKQLIERIEKEVIGEDEVPNPEFELDKVEYGCNKLRFEQRKALTEIKESL